MKQYRFLTILLIALVMLVALPAAAQDAVPWPTTEWATSTPEEQGMDSTEIAALFEVFSQEQFNLDSLVVVRNGTIVAEAYSAPNQPDDLHHIYSASKSVLTGLIGIAIDQGYIKSVDETLLSFFPEYTPANMDERKAAITIKDLLTMGSGFACDSYGADPQTDWMGWDPLMSFPTNSSEVCLDMPMAYAPGEVQQYCQCNTYLLSSILSRTTGMDALEFAKANLFEPLGITEARWLTTPEGVVAGFMGLQLKPRDMAKFGYLYLNNGRWEDRQIIPADYVRDSMSVQIETGWPDTSYGYQWWILPSVNASCALGFGGQYIILNPDKNVAAVLTGAFNDAIRVYLHAYPFVYSLAGLTTAEGALPANPAGVSQLEAVIDKIAHPQPQTVGPMPNAGTSVSDQPFAMLSPIQLMSFGDVQDILIGMVSFHFDGTDQATLTLSPVEEQPKDIMIGLDGLYRVSDFWGGQVAARGQWLTEHDFRVTMRYRGDTPTEQLDFSFMPDAVSVVAFEYTTGEAAGYFGLAAEPE